MSSKLSLTVAIPFYNQLNDAKGTMGLLKFVTSPNTEWLVIDNGSTDPIENFFRQTLRPKRLNFLRNEENVGMVNTYRQIFDTVDTDLVAIIHNDVFIYENAWDQRVIKMFKTIDKLGSLGFFGAQGVGRIGERSQDVLQLGQMAGISNMLEAEVHGIRMVEDFRPAAILDGFAMVFNMAFIRESGGLDPRYQYHHLYDRELPLLAISLGYKNIVLNVSCHHVSGMTANRSEYQEWINAKIGKKEADIFTHDENTKVFTKKWGAVLPLYVEGDFSFRTNSPYKGDAILKIPGGSKK